MNGLTSVSVPCGKIQMSVLRAGAVHCLPSVFANGGSGLIGNSGRKTPSVCDKHAKETIRNIATDVTGFAFTILLRKSPGKVPEDVVKAGG